MRGASERLPARDASRTRLGVHLPNGGPSVFICLFLVRISVLSTDLSPVKFATPRVRALFLLCLCRGENNKSSGSVFSHLLWLRSVPRTLFVSVSPSLGGLFIGLVKMPNVVQSGQV